MATPYLVGLIIEYPENTKLNNVNVQVRLESSNESKTKTTNSSGEVAFNLGNSKDYPSGWAVGDKFSYTIIYQGFEAYGSHTIAVEGGFKATVVLTAVSAFPSLKLFTIQEFLDYFNFKLIEDDAENGVSAQQVVKIGEMVEKDLENDANTVFDDNSGSNYSQTEHIDTSKWNQEYHLTKIPVASITNLYTTQNDQETSPDYPNNTSGWNSLTEGDDYVVDLDTGRVQIVNGSYFPISRRWGLYVSYKQGRTVPSDIKMLAIVETGLRMLGATFIKDRIKKISDIDIPDMISFNQFRKRILGQYTSDGLNTLNT